MLVNLRPLGLGLAVALLIGCSNGAANTPAGPPLRSSESQTQAQTTPPVYEGPDEFSFRTEFEPLLRSQQAAAQATLGEVSWLEEPTFLYRRSLNNSVVASLYVSGTTRAPVEQSRVWLQAANQGLTEHGFSPAAELTTDAGGGLILTSPNPAVDACFSARWGQGSLTLTVEVGATDSPCG